MTEPPKSRVQHFNVRCPAGHRIRGERTLGYQALRCPGCGEGVFVLPLSPLPEPSAPVRRAGTRPVEADFASTEEGPVGLNEIPLSAEFSPGPSSRSVDAEIIWDDQDSEPTPLKEPRIRADQHKPETVDPPLPKKQRSRPGPNDSDDSVPRIRESVGEGAVGSGTTGLRPELKKEIRGPNRSRRRPLLIFLSVALLVLGTLGFRFWKNRRQELPGIYDLGRYEGLAALDAGSFDKAHQLLSAAKGAVESLGGGLEGAEAVLQGANEAAIFVDLLPETLEDLLNEAGPMDAQGWDNRFKAFYAGHGILIDANITAVPADDGRTGFELDYLILPPGNPSRFRDNGALAPERKGKIDLSDFELLRLAQPKLGAHVVFGAKLASFRYDPKAGNDPKDGIWIVRLQPKSGTFITHSKALESAGWPADSVPALKPVEAE